MATTRTNLGKFATRFNGRMSDLKKSVLIRLFRDVIADTPVGTSDPKRGYIGGRLRANWQFTKGQPAEGKLDSLDDPTNKVLTQVNNAVTDKDEAYYLTNNMPYANRIEYEGWSHTKAPEGMVRKNLIRIVKIVQEEANK